MTEPIKFRLKNSTAYGYEATILADICEAVLAAREAGALQKQQLHIAARCEILLRGFARVGIIAMVDEAAGFQEDRARDELAKILEGFVAKEIQRWLPTFDFEFYELICELRGVSLRYAKDRPQYFGHLTNDLIYARLAPAVLEQLQKVNPVVIPGYRRHKHFQHLTPDLGYQRLAAHLQQVIGHMKVAKRNGKSWDGFIEDLDVVLPRWNELPLFDYLEDQKKLAAVG